MAEEREAAKPDALRAMHGELTQVLLTQLRSGEASAAILNVARAFLKDQGIQATADNPQVREVAQHIRAQIRQWKPDGGGGAVPPWEDEDDPPPMFSAGGGS